MSVSQLADIDKQVRAVSDRARMVVQRAGEARVTERPAPDKWSVAECMVHLCLSAEAYFPVWSEALSKARAEGLTSESPFKKDFWGKALSWLLEPPPKFRSSAPAAFKPVETGPADLVLPKFLACQDRWLAVIAESHGLALDRLKIVSPFDGRVRYSVWSSFCVAAAHHRRHLCQAERAADVLTSARH